MTQADERWDSAFTAAHVDQTGAPDLLVELAVRGQPDAAALLANRLALLPAGEARDRLEGAVRARRAAAPIGALVDRLARDARAPFRAAGERLTR